MARFFEGFISGSFPAGGLTMRNDVLLAFFLNVALIFSAVAHQYTADVDGVTWYYNVVDGEACHLKNKTSF